jgi:hypothetical protein
MLSNCTYLAGPTVDTGVNNATDVTNGSTREYMQSEEFADSLGAAFVYVPGNYPVLAMPETVPVTGVTLNRTSARLAAGAELTLTATVTPADANPTVTWTTSNAAVATVTDAGVVKALAVGEAVITAAAGGFTANCAVTVIPEGSGSDVEFLTYKPSKPGATLVGKITIVNKGKEALSFALNSVSAKAKTINPGKSAAVSAKPGDVIYYWSGTDKTGAEEYEVILKPKAPNAGAKVVKPSGKTPAADETGTVTINLTKLGGKNASGQYLQWALYNTKAGSVVPGFDWKWVNEALTPASSTEEIKFDIKMSKTDKYQVILRYENQNGDFAPFYPGSLNAAAIKDKSYKKSVKITWKNVYK